jgi:hypothetical protein
MAPLTIRVTDPGLLAIGECKDPRSLTAVPLRWIGDVNL